MALNKALLKNEIKSLLEDMMTREDSSFDEFATRLSDSIDQFVKGANIIYNSGLTAGGNPVSGTFNGNLE